MSLSSNEINRDNEKINVTETFNKILPVIQNAMYKGKGYSREELLESGLFEKIISESLEEIEPLYPSQNGKEKNISFDEVHTLIRNTLSDQGEIENLQDAMNKILSM